MRAREIACVCTCTRACILVLEGVGMDGMGRAGVGIRVGQGLVDGGMRNGLRTAVWVVFCFLMPEVDGLEVCVWDVLKKGLEQILV